VDAWIEGLDADPLAELGRWLDEAREAGLHEPDAMALATATPAGRPSVRMVLLRGLDAGGLRFFTNHESRKGGELAANPEAAVVLNWGPPLRRQARVEGRVERLTDDESLAYFRTRARESRLGAWASPQSRAIADRDALDERYEAVRRRFAGVEDVPLPDFWGGYLLVPRGVELWRSRPNRLHDRARYERSADGWARARLAP
jgi:pyridoxamine 5'-phosphate oxidase